MMKAVETKAPMEDNTEIKDISPDVINFLKQAGQKPQGET